MEEYPKEIVQDPQPLVFLIGTVDNEPDFHQRLIRSLDGTNVDNSDYKEFPKLAYFICPSSSSDRNVYQDVQFPTKKLPKEIPTTEGILRSDWLIKHHEQLPSVVLFITSFSVDWSLSEWIKREAGFYERYSRLKATLGLADKDVMDERINSLKRHLQLDSKTLHVLTVAEIVADSLTMKKTLKTVRDASFSYFTHLYKKLKLFERLSKTKGMFEHGLSIRYSIKLAFILEFLGQIYQSLQSYKQAFKALQDFSQQFTQDTLYYKTDNLLDQAKCLADYINFKICKVLIKNGQFNEAYLQFKLFISIFSKIRTNFIKATLWKHFIWLARQFVVYVELLDQFSVPESAAGTFRSYYYENAAKYFKEAFHILNQKSNEITNKNNHNNSYNNQSWQLAPPKYFSYLPAIYDSNQNKIIFDVLNIFDYDQNASVCYEFMSRIMLSNDLKIDYKSIILYYLNLAFDYTDRSSKRQCARIHMLIGDHHMLSNNFELASTHYTPIITQLILDKWINTELFISVMKKKNQCEFFLGNSDLFIQSSLIIYSLLLHQIQHFSKSFSNSKLTATVNIPINNNVQETEIFHKILHILQSNDKLILENSVVNVIENSPTLSNQSSNIITTFQLLPNPYRISLQECINIFDIKISYNHKIIILNSQFEIQVNLILTSLLKYDLYIKELILHFSSPFSSTCVLTKKFKNSNILPNYDNNNNNNNNNNDNNDNGTMNDNIFEFKSFDSFLSPDSPLHLNFTLNIEESMLDMSSHTEWIIFLESFELMTSFPLQSQNIQNGHEKHEKQNFRDVIFLVPTVQDKFLKILEKNLKTIGASDILKYTDESFLPPSVLVLKPPKPLIEIIPYTYIYENNTQSTFDTNAPLIFSDLETVHVTKLCQGILQQMNVYFRVDQCNIYNCKVYLSVDYSPDTSKSSFFWYPDIESLVSQHSKHSNSETGISLDNTQLQQHQHQQNTVNDDSDENNSFDLDQLRFYPFVLNASMQPSQPLFLNNLQKQLSESESESGFIFCIPLFIRAELEGLFKIKFLFEYQSNPHINSQIYSTECYLDIIFQNSIDVKFKITTTNNSIIPKTVSINSNSNNDTKNITVASSSTDPVTLYSNLLSQDNIIDSSISSTSQSINSNNSNSNSVLREGTVVLSSYVTCTNPVHNQYIQLQNIAAYTNYNHNNNLNGNSNSSNNNFLCLDSKLYHQHQQQHHINTNTNTNTNKSKVSSPRDKLHSSSHIHTLLKSGELFCHYSQFFCKNKEKNHINLQDITPSLESLGYVKVSLKLIDFNFMKSPPKLVISSSNSKNVITSQESIPKRNIQNCNKITIKEIQNISDWLFPIANLSIQSLPPPLTIDNDNDNDNGIVESTTDSSSEGILDKSAYVTRISKFVYSAPSVRIIETPFIVHFIQPKTIQLDNHIIIECKIKSNLNSVECVQFHVIPPSDINSNDNSPFLLRGVSRGIITLMPKEEHTVKLTVVPLIAGELQYPEISVTWMNEVNNADPQSTTVNDQNSKLQISFTNNDSDRNVFVFP